MAGIETLFFVGLDRDKKQFKAFKAKDSAAEVVGVSTLHDGNGGGVRNGNQESEKFFQGGMATAAIGNISNAVGATFNFHFNQHHP